MKTRKRIVKEGFYKGEIATRSMDKLASIEGDLVSICNDIKLVFGKDSDVFARVDLLRTDCGEALDLLDNALKGMKYDEPVKLSESGDDSGWFDARGDLLKPLPGACIMACSGQGRVDDDIDFWTRELGFDVGFPVEKAARYLQEYGAWEDLDLLADVANTGDKAKLTEWLKDNGNDEDIGRSTFDVKGFATRVLAHRVLWIFCNDLKELAYEMMDDETSLVSDWGDPSTWGDDEWERFQKEYSYCSLNN